MPEKEKDTYEMRFICNNCGHHFIRKIEKGREAQGQGGECPYCGCEDHYYGGFVFKRLSNSNA